MTRQSAENVEAQLLAHFGWNPWFRNEFWTENRGRILRVLGDMIEFSPPGNGTRVLDVGCFNGYGSALFALSGYTVTAVDSYDDEQRSSLFGTLGRITYHKLNLNADKVFVDWPDGEFDMAFMGEVFEHIVNWPLQVLKQVRRLLKLGGRLYLTTPNPATLLNSWRMITGRYDLRGTTAFATEPKIVAGRVITNPEIHYREYTRTQLHDVLQAAGFEIVAESYIIPGARREEPWIKRLAKTAASVVFPQMRLISSCQYVTCENPRHQSRSSDTPLALARHGEQG